MGGGKVKIVHCSLLHPFGGNLEDSENEASEQDVQWTVRLHPGSVTVVRWSLKLC